MVAMNRLKTILTNVCRVLLGLTFIFSGYVKAIDPLGTQYKIQDYLKVLDFYEYVPDWLTLMVSVVLSAVEFSLGIFMLFAIRRRIVSRLMVALMTVMTAVTAWLYVADPIKDCGCFGDAVTLTNGQTLAKNVVLLFCALVTVAWPMRMGRLVSRTNQWIVINYTALFIFLTSVVCLYKLPVFDFRPYHVGADLRKGMEIPQGAPQPEFVTTFIMEKNGQRREFSLEDYPDSTWTFIDSKTVQTKAGYVPPIHDFSITLNSDDEDITKKVIDDPGYTFLLISPHLEQADDGNFGIIDQIYEYAQDYHVPFYCLTASTQSAINHWIDITGAEYPFCTTDETTLKTIIRSNPGLVLLRNGVVVNKWSHNELPRPEELNGPLDKIPVGKMPNESVGRKIAMVLSWFALPLALLVLADRLWAWTRWVKRKEKSNRLFQIFKH